MIEKLLIAYDGSESGQQALPRGSFQRTSLKELQYQHQRLMR